MVSVRMNISAWYNGLPEQYKASTTGPFGMTVAFGIEVTHSQIEASFGSSLPQVDHATYFATCNALDSLSSH